MRRRQVLATAGGLLTFTPTTAATRRPSSFGPLGRVAVPGAKEVVVAPDGSIAYLATTDGFATVDLSDPTSPTVLAERRDLLAEREGGPLAAIWDVKLHDGRLVVPGPASGSRDVSGFLLFDVSDPERPERLAFYPTTFPIHNAFFVDGRVYMTAGGRIVVVDVSTDDPTEVGRWSPADVDSQWTEVPRALRSPHDLWVQDDTAYVPCWDAGTWIVDLSDPASPGDAHRVGGRGADELAALSSSDAARTTLEPPGNHHYAQPSSDGSLLAIGKESWATDDGRGGAGGIDLWDVADPSSPSKLSTIPPPPSPDETRSGVWTTAHNFDLAGDRLYSSWYQGGVKLHDVSDPSNPVELAWWRRPDDAAFWGAVLATDEFFATSSTNYPAPSAFEGLYTFPNREGEQVDPPPMTRTPAQTANEPGSNGSDAPGGRTATDATQTGTEPTRSTSDTSTDVPSPPSTASEPVTPTDPTTTPGQPGFELLAAIGGVGFGAWRMLHTVDDED